MGRVGVPASARAGESVLSASQEQAATGTSHTVAHPAGHQEVMALRKHTTAHRIQVGTIKGESESSDTAGGQLQG